MMAELGIALLITAVGYFALMFLSDIPVGARAWLSFPVGASIYLMVALSSLVFAGSLGSRSVLAWTGALGAAAAVAALVTGAWKGRTLVWLGASLALATFTVIVAREVHLTRLTPDSLRYLLFAAEMQLPDALGEIHRVDLLKRQMGLPALQTLSSLTDRRYLASMGPLFGTFGGGTFVWLIWAATRRFILRRRLLLTLAAALLLLSSNRLLYDVFYINGHIEVAVYLLIAIMGAWLAAYQRSWQWAVPAGLALGVTLLFRAEAPIVAGIILVAIGAGIVDWPTRWWIVIPTTIVAGLWYAIILWRHASGGDTVSLTAPVFGSLVLVFAATLAVLLGGLVRMRPLTRHLDKVMLIGLLALLAFFGIRNLDVLWVSLEATAWNLAYRGLWLLTWPAVVGLLAVALLVHRVPEGRIWVTPIIGFGLVFWLLPLLREGAWRVGTGDSGNRILAHILAVCVAFIVLAAIDSWPERFGFSHRSGSLAGPDRLGGRGDA